MLLRVLAQFVLVQFLLLILTIAMRSAIFAALAVQATATDGKCCWSK